MILDPRRLALFALFALPLAATSAAQTAAPARDRALPSVTVSAAIIDRAPDPARAISSTSLDADQIRAAGPLVDLAEALAGVPGVVANNRWNFAQDAQLSIRGQGARATFGVRGIKLYVNGIPATAADGQGQIGHAPLAALDQIEVIRGPLAVLYGNAAGGVIKIESDPTRIDAPSLLALAADANARRTGLTLRRGDGTRGWVFDASDFRTDGFRPHSRATRRSAHLATALALPDDWRLDASANALEVPRAQDPLGLSAAEFAADPYATNPAALTFNTRERADQRELGAALSRTGSAARANLRAAGYIGRRGVDGFLPIPVAAQANPLSGGGANAIVRDYAGVELRAGWRFGRAALTLGFNQDQLDEHRRGFENFVGSTLGVRGALRRDEHNRVVSRDLLLEAQYQAADTLRVVGGIRRSRVGFDSADRFSSASNPDDSGARSYRAWVPALGLTWTPSAVWSTRASIGRGFDTPTVTELSYRPDGSAGLNFALEPARSRQAELGLRGAGEGWNLDAAIFRSDGRGELTVARSQFGRASFRNAGRSRRDGLELAAGLVLNDTLRLDLGATLIDARYTQSVPACPLAPCPPGAQALLAGNSVPGIPPRSARLALTWRPAAPWRVQSAIDARAAVPVNDANSARAAGYGLLDVVVARDIAIASGVLALEARLDNVFDRAVVGSVIVNDGNGRFFETAPPRRLWLGATWRW